MRPWKITATKATGQLDSTTRERFTEARRVAELWAIDRPGAVVSIIDPQGYLAWHHVPSLGAQLGEGGDDGAQLGNLGTD
jgi:hypothetical protein